MENGRAASVDVGKPYNLGSTVVVSCTAAQVGRVFPLTFDVRVAGDVIGTVGGHAQCGALPKRAAVPPRRHHAASHPSPAPAPVPSKSPPAPAPVPPPPAAPHTPPAAAVAPPPPPPAPAPVSPVPSASPASAPAGAPSGAAAPAHGGAGLAVAPQQEINPQVATQRTGRDGDHAMLSARRARSPVPEPALVTLGLGGATAFGWAAWVADARRRRRSLAVQPADRGYPRPPHGRR